MSTSAYVIITGACFQLIDTILYHETPPPYLSDASEFLWSFSCTQIHLHRWLALILVQLVCFNTWASRIPDDFEAFYSGILHVIYRHFCMCIKLQFVFWTQGKKHFYRRRGFPNVKARVSRVYRHSHWSLWDQKCLNMLKKKFMYFFEHRAQRVEWLSIQM